MKQNCNGIAHVNLAKLTIIFFFFFSHYRAIGCLHNSPEFDKAFNCPEGSYMNPPSDDKCTVW